MMIPGTFTIEITPKTPIMLNQINIIGPNPLPTNEVPNRCIKNKKVIIATTI